MKNIMITITMSILLASMVSAIYAGECMEVDLSELDHSKDILYLVTGNASNLEGMNIALNSSTNNASVCFAINYKPDVFNLVFFNKEKEVVVEHRYSSSGGSSSSRTIYIQNKTIVEVPEYIDKIIYKENKTDTPDEIIDIEDIGLSWWYLYGFVLVVISGVVYWWVQRIYVQEDKDTTEE